MKKFIYHILIVFLPILLIVSIFILRVEKTGELSKVENCVKIQRENATSLLGMAYNENKPYYKLLNANYYKSDVIALGTSRVMQFKDYFFTKSFYNCGGAVSGNFDEYKNFLMNLDYNPEIIILGIDNSCFNDSWMSWQPDYSKYKSIPASTRSKDVLLKAIFEDLKNKKWNFDDLSNYPENIGVSGKVKDSGFMNDGSYYYGDIYRSPENKPDSEFKETIGRIADGRNGFEYGNDICESALIQLRELLEYCRQNNIYVIGFSTPYAPAIYDILISTGKYDYLNNIGTDCSHIFDEYDFEYYDFINGSLPNVTNDYYIDGLHGSEIVYGKIIVAMSEAGSLIGNCADTEYINSIIDNRYNNLCFYSPFDR
ncbi:MAG: hypothetical protein MJ107_00505 [Lachnospiraceae bacterium]|nr:hypothetical protein [Lachnospiraceae bacterium]